MVAFLSRGYFHSHVFHFFHFFRAGSPPSWLFSYIRGPIAWPDVWANANDFLVRGTTAQQDTWARERRLFLFPEVDRVVGTIASTDGQSSGIAAQCRPHGATPGARRRRRGRMDRCHKHGGICRRTTCAVGAATAGAGGGGHRSSTMPPGRRLPTRGT